MKNVIRLPDAIGHPNDPAILKNTMVKVIVIQYGGCKGCLKRLVFLGKLTGSCDK